MATDLRVQLPPANYAVKQLVEGKQHFYEVTHDDGQVERFPGVTGVLGIISKPALVPWATKTALENAKEALLEQLDGKAGKKINLTELWIKAVIETAKKVPEKVKTEAGDLGTLAHAYFEAFIRGEEKLTVVPAIQPAVEAFSKWMAESGLQIVGGDTKVASVRHGYGGALDALAMDEDGAWTILDWKTGNGIYAEYALQVAAYAHAFEETYGIRPWRGIIVRFGKKEPVKFEVREVRSLRESFEAFLAAKSLQDSLKQEQFLD